MLCRRCNVEMKPGKTLIPTASEGVPDFAGDAEASTFSLSGKAVLLDAMKCPACGHTVAGGK